LQIKLNHCIIWICWPSEIIPMNFHTHTHKKL
jgi:hypothetical protein